MAKEKGNKTSREMAKFMGLYASASNVKTAVYSSGIRKKRLITLALLIIFLVLLLVSASGIIAEIGIL